MRYHIIIDTFLWDNLSHIDILSHCLTSVNFYIIKF